MENEAVNISRQKRALWIMAMVNVGIWAIAMIAMVFVMQRIRPTNYTYLSQTAFAGRFCYPVEIMG